MKWLLAGSVLVHAVLLVGLFETHFTSPIVRGIEPAPLPGRKDTPTALADRVVFIVADGARADKVRFPRLPVVTFSSDFFFSRQNSRAGF